MFLITIVVMVLYSSHPSFIYGTLVQRYKRFLADVRLDSGDVVTVHCPNPGRMLTCASPGSRVRLSDLGEGKRRYRFRLDLVHTGDCWVGVNPTIANHMVWSAIEQGVLFPKFDAKHWSREVNYATNARIDFFYDGPKYHTYVEVKSVTYVVDGVGFFPDAVSRRACKHLKALQSMCQLGHNAVVVYCIQRGDASTVQPACDIDPEYAHECDLARDAGVSFMTLPVTFDDAGAEARCLL